MPPGWWKRTLARLGSGAAYAGQARRCAAPLPSSAVSAPDPAPATPRDWPGVSVVMPVRDEERHLHEAVGSVLGQDYPGMLELVLALD